MSNGLQRIINDANDARTISVSIDKNCLALMVMNCYVLWKREFWSYMKAFGDTAMKINEITWNIWTLVAYDRIKNILFTHYLIIFIYPPKRFYTHYLNASLKYTTICFGCNRFKVVIHVHISIKKIEKI